MNKRFKYVWAISFPLQELSLSEVLTVVSMMHDKQMEDFTEHSFLKLFFDIIKIFCCNSAVGFSQK